MAIDDLKKEFEVFALGTGGIGNWLTKDADEEIYKRILEIPENPLRKVQLNQLLVMGHEAPVSDGFFDYYWCTNDGEYLYDISSSEEEFKFDIHDPTISSIAQFKWGLSRVFIDSLLAWGSVRTGYRELRNMTFEQLSDFFISRRFDTKAIKKRGPFLPLEKIAKDDRYLISEMACKSYESNPDKELSIQDLLITAYQNHSTKKKVTINELLTGEFIEKNHQKRQIELTFSVDEILDHEINSAEELKNKIDTVYKKFTKARSSALLNTKRYLSMVSDLDVYVATSMRNRKDFREMGSKTTEIFSDARLQDLELRYFDPTLSAADGHENKGLIECLMVKCAKVLVYCAGEKESYGKDAEAAMALSLGKPVIFLTDHEQKARFYKDIHPLSRLIDFETGVAVGAIVTDSQDQVSELLSRIFKNEMQYELLHDGKGYLRLKEKLTGSIIRLKTNDHFLNEPFWNPYHEG